jgi:hypothetical protein
MAPKRSDDEEAMRKKLENENQSIIDNANGVIDMASGILKDANEAKDAAILGKQAAKFGSRYGDWESAFSATEQLNKELARFEPMKGLALSIHPVISSSSTGTVYSGSALVTGGRDDFDSDFMYQEAAKVNQGYSAFFEKYAIRDSVLKLMAERKFDGSKNGREAIAKFKGGWEMYYRDMPEVDMDINTVIPVREAIRMSRL